ncbi:MFS transporter [Anseongella ginsenosidimutans]|uniref:MFS transporter n=1 Tax=Anseongella ginsenosidimutans TaxID=496056 RepID=A0A4R3KT96_9SPHI|nr:MFS transporter [Anseongella ginsenosidimutans]QEC53123.1 MFS transporter [Anseongella ginsenosidimutans]TCS87741.1 MFS transporter [Anseongella ginsenosidimutans]
MKKITLLIIVAALGYFVDIYDLVLFAVIRVESLKGIGITDPGEIFSNGVFLMNMQMAGMLVGGILWGVFGDKKGRVAVLFGSILIYSLANIANGFVTSVTMYGIIRFIAGVGLAGELGAGITLVSETMSKENRGYGAMIVATVGILGAVVAAQVADKFSWQTAYFVGGGMGLVLLVLRIGVFESGMYKRMEQAVVKKGNFLMLFTDGKRFKKYLNCILIGIPIWYVVAILVAFSPELGRALEVSGTLSAGKAIMFSYIGLAIGDLISGTLSQVFKTRKKVVGWFIAATLVMVLVTLLTRGSSPGVYYFICVLLGMAAGYWAIFLTIASEQFGTNLRATVTTTTPNFVRGSVVPVTILFEWLSGSIGIIYSALLIGLVTIGIAFWALWYMDETFGKELDYIES